MTGVEARYKRWGLWLVLVAPFLDGVRQLNAFIAGMLGMGWWQFTAAKGATETAPYRQTVNPRDDPRETERKSYAVSFDWRPIESSLPDEDR